MSTPASPPRIGRLAAGPLDAITDVSGVTVGHVTRDEGDVQTGVTVIRPHAGDPYRDKVPAGLAVINGFGKSVGLVQLEELGQLETPIALTNTFSVPTLSQAQIRDCAAHNPETGRGQPALAAAGTDFAQGAVGAGRGMSSFQLKGGIGSASRRVPLRHGGSFTVGALVLANYGLLPNLLWGGQAVDAQLAKRIDDEAHAQAGATEKGSIIMVLATDAPLDARQLGRLALRAGVGLARTGSVYGHGSGDIALAFSTAYTLPHLPERPMPAVTLLHETQLDGLFQAAADSVEQAIVHALWHAQAVAGRNGHRRAALRDLLAPRR
ncbi:MAG: Beta-peptidyl aminopeptidase BapA [Paracidovorax wautersii]|uniref:Beta-peptidyl aminopeptidase BapA n=1 Tax=Paracidovorax wautersii TaxID=1177982 RepID=A0A7V8FPL7_9BURK|nr:MAG: Beta-peptidyl aminopeptidase BapA [Paracidovorax wautersii]